MWRAEKDGSMPEAFLEKLTSRASSTLKVNLTASHFQGTLLGAKVKMPPNGVQSPSEHVRGNGMRPV